MRRAIVHCLFFILTVAPASYGAGVFQGLGGEVVLNLSADGTAAVGYDGQIGVRDERAWHWTTTGGKVFLPELRPGTTRQQASGVSADGSVVVGYGNSDEGVRYFIWDAMMGMRDLEHLFRDEYGLRFDGWKLTASSPVGGPLQAAPISISADGRTFAGAGINPAGNRESWIVVVPEPSSAVLIGLVGLPLLRRRRHNSDPLALRVSPLSSGRTLR